MPSPFQHPWLSGIFGDEEIATVLSAKADLNRMLKIEAAWTQALGTSQNRPEANNIAEKILELNIQPEDLRDGTAKDGLPVPALVKFIKSHFNENEQSLIHIGLTSQDVIDTARMLALCDAAKVINDRLQTLNAALDALKHKVEGRGLMAITRMQPALPISAETVVKT